MQQQLQLPPPPVHAQRCELRERPESIGHSAAQRVLAEVDVSEPRAIANAACSDRTNPPHNRRNTESISTSGMQRGAARTRDLSHKPVAIKRTARTNNMGEGAAAGAAARAFVAVFRTGL